MGVGHQEAIARLAFGLGVFDRVNLILWGAGHRFAYHPLNSSFPNPTAINSLAVIQPSAFF
jgi:hypothetical protein